MTQTIYMHTRIHASHAHMHTQMHMRNPLPQDGIHTDTHKGTQTKTQKHNNTKIQKYENTYNTKTHAVQHAPTTPHAT